MHNGEVKELPAIQVAWDEEAQDVHLKFDPMKFRNWNFVIATLEMAISSAEDQKRIALARSMQAQQMQGIQLASLRPKL